MSVLPVVPNEVFDRSSVCTGMCSAIMARSATSHAAAPSICERSCPCISAICTAADARLTISDVPGLSSGPLWVICRACTGRMSTKSSGSCFPDRVRVSQARRSASEHSPFVVSGTCSVTESSRVFCFGDSCNREVKSRHFLKRFQCDVQLHGCFLCQMLPENAKTIWPTEKDVLHGPDVTAWRQALIDKLQGADGCRVLSLDGTVKIAMGLRRYETMIPKGSWTTEWMITLVS